MDDEYRTDPEKAEGARERTKRFALRILRLCAALPATTEAQVLGKQALRCGTSVGALYRQAHRARTTAEFVSKLEVALQELDETIYWLELLGEGEVIAENRLSGLIAEASELIAIIVASVKRAKGS